MSLPYRDPFSSAALSVANHGSPRTSSESARSSNPAGQPRLSVSHSASASEKHRQSFSDLRYPPSPRTHRQPSLSSIAVQELIDNPPTRASSDPRFAGRDWRTVKIGELTNPEHLKFVDANTPVEAATNILVESEAPVLLIQEHNDRSRIVGTFDYNTLNAYLLLAIGLAHPHEPQIEDFGELLQKAREGKPIPLKDIKDLGRKEPLAFLLASSDLEKAIETFGRGVHRVLVTEDDSDKVIGVLSQSRLIRFLWENGRSFPVIDQLYTQYLRDLRVGSQDVIAINGDRPLVEALATMSDEGVSSLAVVDNGANVVGNISTVDVRLLTKSSALPLLGNTCIHFISVILSTRGLFEGKDSFPVFHVTPLNTLAHTVAKLVTTQSHRLWITEPQSPQPSAPPTPGLQTATMVPTGSHRSSLSAGSGQHYLSPPAAETSDPLHVVDASPKTPTIAPSGPSISASALPGARLSGRLVGVVSMTDILILFAKAGGMDVADPNELRLRRRRSSSSSVRKSIDLGARPRPSFELLRKVSNT